MDTLDIQFDKYRFRHGFAPLIWRLRNSKLMWKLQNSKWPWGTVYRYFWRKRLMKRINAVSNMIAIQSRQQLPYLPYIHSLYDFPPEIPPTGIGTYAGTSPVNPSRMYAQTGIAVMDPKFIPPIYVHCDI